MAEKIALFESFLSCHLCSKTFRDPVSLSCNHSFCLSCLQKFWEKAKNIKCPICTRRASKKDLSINFPLKELAASFAERENNRLAATKEEKEHEKEEVVCEKHPEIPYWFCEDEDKAVCPACEFSLHKSHMMVPIEQAVSDLKGQLEPDLNSLKDKREKCERAKKTYNEMIQYSKKQLLSTEGQIRAEFSKLHQFLEEEEASRLAALREEEEQKGKTISREMKMIQEQISSLSDGISAVEEELRKHNVPFLSSFRATQTRARAQCSLSDPQLVSGALTDVAKHLGNLSFRVWEKMKEKVHFSTVILDPNTANPRLHLSDDLTSLKCGDTRQQLPDNPERNIKYATVLGSEGFSSGKHSWEVEVGDYPNWTVGLAKESVERKGHRLALPAHGIWCLGHRGRKYADGHSETITVKKSLWRIRVQLDYDKGEVSFYDAEDETHISTLRDTFTEKLLPFFSIGEAGDAKTTEMKIRQPEISL